MAVSEIPLGVMLVEDILHIFQYTVLMLHILQAAAAEVELGKIQVKPELELMAVQVR